MEGGIKLADVAAVLHDMHEAGIVGDYAVGRASAVAFYSEPIATKDLDIFFLFDPPQTGAILSLEPIYKYCRERGYTYNHEFISIGARPKDVLKIQHFVENEVLNEDKLRQILIKFDIVEAWKKIQGELPNELKF